MYIHAQMYVRILKVAQSDDQDVADLSMGMVDSITDLERYVNDSGSMCSYFREAIDWTFKNLNERGLFSCVHTYTYVYIRMYVHACM